MNYELLKDARRNAGITQEIMAAQLGYKDKSSYCQIENGTVRCTIEQAKRIKEVLNLPLEMYAQIFLSE